MTDDVSRVFMNASDFATTGVIYTVDGQESTFTAVVFDEQIDENEVREGRRARRFRDVQIGRDPEADCGGVENPRLDAKLTIGGVHGTVYAIESIVYQDDDTTTVRCVRIEATERSRPGYRGTR